MLVKENKNIRFVIFIVSAVNKQGLIYNVCKFCNIKYCHKTVALVRLVEFY